MDPNVINPFTAKCGQRQISTKCPNVICYNFDKHVAPYESTGRELSFEWSHHRISSADSKVRLALQNSIKHSGSEGVKYTKETLGPVQSIGMNSGKRTNGFQKL